MQKTMSMQEQVGRDPVTYEAPVLEPARVRFGAQERNSPGDVSNILCNECHG